MRRSHGSGRCAAVACAVAAALLMASGAPAGEGSGLSGGSSGFQKSGGGNRRGGGGGGSGGGGKRLGEYTPAPALPAPGSSVGPDGETEATRKARSLQAAHGQVAGEEAFMRTLRAHFVPGTWKPDQIADPSDGSTLLHYAVRQGYPEAVRYLLRQGANPLSRDLPGITPLALAKELKLEEIARLLDDAVAARNAAGAATPTNSPAAAR